MADSIQLTVADVQGMVASGRFRGLLDLLRQLGSLDFAKLRLLLAAIEKVQVATTPQEKIRAILTVLKIGAELTATPVDDTLVDVIDKLMTDAMIDVLLKVIRLFAPDLLPRGTVVNFSAVDVDVVTAQGIPWDLIMQLVPLILAILRQLWPEIKAGGQSAD